MKFNEIQILCIVLLFYLIANQEIPIINFSENNYEIGTNLFIYEPEPIISPEYEGEAFFFFRFSGLYSTSLYVYESDSDRYSYIQINDENIFYQFEIFNLATKKNLLSK